MARRSVIILSLLLLFISVGGVFFYSYTSNFEKEKVRDSKAIKGLILPHHDLAEELFHSSLQRIKENQSPKLIVIYGPNHHYPDSATITTTKSLSDAPLAYKEIELLVRNFPDIVVNNALVEGEHSITTPLTYLQEYFPGAEIIPLVFSTEFNVKELQVKANYLTANLPADTLYIASVDFAHEVDLEEGLNRNKESIEALSNFDFEDIYNFNDEHLDSPVSIAMFLLTMKNLKAENWETWFSNHSALIKNDPTLQGTSYVVGVFR